MRYKTIICLVFLLVVTGCHRLPNGVLPAKKMVPVLVDIHLSDAINTQKFNLSLLKDSLPEDLYLSICRKHKIERTDLEKSLLYYGKHTREYMPIYDQVLDALNEMAVKAKSDSIRPAHIGGFDLDTSKTRKSSPPPGKTDMTKK